MRKVTTSHPPVNGGIKVEILQPTSTNNMVLEEKREQKRVLRGRALAAVVLALFLIGSGCETGTTSFNGVNSRPLQQPISITPQPAPALAPAPAQAPATVRIPSTETANTNTQPIAPNGFYKNVDNVVVPSPYIAPSAPVGATAQCRDGSYSFSQHRSGTCSHHGGVAEWF